MSRRDLRLYVVDTPHWNAFVAPNGAIWVFTGLLRDIESDDELAAALGHELAHYTHEHGRRQVKRNYWIGLTAAVAGEMVSGMNPGRAQWAASAAHELAFNAWTHHYDRKDEDQAGRVGLRYRRRLGTTSQRRCVFGSMCSRPEVIRVLPMTSSTGITP